MDKGISDEIAMVLDKSPRPMSRQEVAEAIGHPAGNVGTLLAKMAKRIGGRPARWRRVYRNAYWHSG
jgi:hypothetical protein